MPEQPPTYDLVSVLRVLYRRRKMIGLGTVVATVVVAVASLVWPQTWRAESYILVSTPRIKEEQITILSRPLDVLAYRSLLVDQSMLSTVLARLRWLHSSLHAIHDDPVKRKVLLENLGLREGEIEFPLLIQRTDVPNLVSVIYGDSAELYDKLGGSEPLSSWPDERVRRLQLLDTMSAEEIKAVFDMDASDLEDLTLSDLRELLDASVTKVKETNLETEYSRIIDVRGEFDTAARAMMITNLWIRSFLDRAEDLARREIVQRTSQIRRYADQLAEQLDKAYTAYYAELAASGLDDLNAELAAKRALLYGVSEERSEQSALENQFDLEQENVPFLTELLRRETLTRFAVQSNFPDALLPQLAQVEAELEVKQNLLKTEEKSGFSSSSYDATRAEISALEARRDALLARVAALLEEIKNLREKVKNNEAQLVTLRRNIETLENQVASHQRQLQQADILIGGMQQGQRFADVQAGTAVKPDKRVFPKRALMTGIGMVVSLILFSCFAFILEVWPRISQEAT